MTHFCQGTQNSSSLSLWQNFTLTKSVILVSYLQFKLLRFVNSVSFSFIILLTLRYIFQKTLYVSLEINFDTVKLERKNLDTLIFSILLTLLSKFLQICDMRLFRWRRHPQVVRTRLFFVIIGLASRSSCDKSSLM